MLLDSRSLLTTMSDLRAVAVMVAVAVVPAALIGVAVGVAVALAHDKLRSVCAGSLGYWEEAES
jgi:ABC-type proline/glycine betaine transport system permease subunit